LIRGWFRGRWRLPRQKRRPTSRLCLEALEWRIVPSAIPTAALTAPTTNLIGQDVPLSVAFTNMGDAPGFGPFVDIEMPVVGVAPPPNNGISFNPGSATFLGQAVPTTVLTFDASGNATHPFAVDNTGAPVVIHGTPGDQLVVFSLPFSSYSVGQPPAVINFTGHVSVNANMTTALPITATGGFSIGADPISDPTTDPSIFGPPDTETVLPTVLQLTKTYNGSENETVTGPNFPQTYTLSLNVANGQTLTNVLITDQLPDNLQFVKVTAVSGNGATVITPTSVPSTTTPGGTLTYHFDTIVGTTAASEATLVFQFFIPQKDANGDDVIDLATGGTATSVDHSSANGLWTSPSGPTLVETDANDPNTIHTLTDKTLAVQKTVTDLNGGSAKPGDVLQYTLKFQVSDFFALSGVILNDLVSDGQTFLGTFTPTISYTQRGPNGIKSGSFSVANFSATGVGDGSTAVDFDISSQLAALGLGSGSVLLGAAIPPGGTGGPSPSPKPRGPGTTGTITFRVTVNSNYSSDNPSFPNKPVVQGDVLSDHATINGTVLNFADLTPTTSTVTDGSSASVTLQVGTLTKKIYAINGVVNPTSDSVNPGETVTYELIYTLPTSSVEDYQLTDFLPLPTLPVGATPFTFNAVVNAAIPGLGQAKFGPSDTFFAISGLAPTQGTTDTAENSLNFFFGTTTTGSNISSVSDILFTVRVSDNPFAGSLVQNNMAQAQESSFTGSPSFSQTAVAPINVNQPDVTITKGVVSTNDPNGVFSGPVGPAGVTFAKPGLATPAFTGLVTSAGLAAQPVSATLSNVDAGDLVKSAIVIENTGRSSNGAFQVEFKDTLPAGFAIPAGGLNLMATDGTGAAFQFVVGGDLFGAGLELQDPGPTPTPTGALDPGETDTGAVINNGRNIAVITYDLVLTAAVTPLEQISNTATLTSFASTPTGGNFVPGGVDAKTSVTIATPKDTKTLLNTSIQNSANSKTQVVIGELATYQIHVIIPEGTTPAAMILDTLPAGLAYVGLDPANPPVLDPGISLGMGGSTTPTAAGQLLTFNFGDVTNTNTDNVPRGITVTYQVVTLNIAGNKTGTPPLANSAQFSWTGHTLTPVSAAGVSVIEPKLTTTKSVVVNGSGSSGQGGNSVVYTIKLQQAAASQTNAFDMTLNDPLPILADGSSLIIGTTFSVADTAGTITVANFNLTGSNATGFTLSTTGTGFDFPLSPSGRTITITIRGILSTRVPDGSSFVNTDTIQWTSLPGDPGEIIPGNPDSTERTGTGGVNNYVASSSATVTTIKPTVAKTLVSTSIVSPTNANNQAVIGELVNYKVVVTIPHGNTNNAVLTDTLPSGLAFVQPTGFSNSNPGQVTVPGSTTPTVVSPGQTITYTLGNITNTDTDNGTLDTLTFTYQVVVLNTTGNVINTPLTNSAQLKFNLANSTSPVSAAPVFVIEPKLQVTKTATPAVAEAGNVITYTVVLSHAGNSQTDAFDVALADTLPAGETLVPGSLKNTAGRVPTTLTSAGATISATFDELPFGATSTLTYQVQLDTSVTPGQTLINSVLETWTSLSVSPTQISPFNTNSFERTGNPADPGQLNNYRFTAVAPINIKQPSLVKTVVSTSISSTGNSRAVIGELINYAITVTIPQGTTPNADLIDLMPAGLAFVQMNTPAIVNSDPADVTFANPLPPNVGPLGQLIDFDLGTITNTDTNSSIAETLTFNIQAVVLNVNSNVRGQTLVNQASLTWNNGANSTGEVLSPTVTVIEPKLLTTKAVTIGGNGGNPGDPVTYTIRIQSDPTNQTAAIAATVSDAFPTSSVGGPSIIQGLTLTSVSDTIGVVTAANFDLSGSDATGYTLSTVNAFNFAKAPAARVITLTFKGTLGTNVQPGETVVNTDEVQWNSVGTLGEITNNNPNSVRRTGNAADPGELNDYVTSSSASFTVHSADLAVVKTVNNPTPNVGATIVFTITLTNNGPNTAHGVTLLDPLPNTLPGGLAFISATPSQGTYNPGTGIWTVGTVATGAANAETLRITARVKTPTRSLLGPTFPAAQTNVATITHSDELDPNTTNNQDSVTVTPQSADLYVLKTVDDRTPQVGQTVTYTITLGDNGPNAGTNVRLVDTFPVLPAIVHVLTITPAPGTTYADGVWSVPSIAVGATKILTITARVVALGLNAPILGANVVAITRADQFDPNLLNNIAATAIQPLAADLVVVKTVDDPTPQVGQTITYTVKVQNLGPDPATNALLTDTLPSGFTVTGSHVTVGSFTVGTGVWAIGGMAVGDIETLTITGTVDTPTRPAVPNPLINSATATATEADPNPGNNTGTATATPQYADLAVNKTVNNPTPDVGSAVTFTIALTNLGPNTAQDTTVSDLLPAGVTFVSARPNVGSYDSGTGVWTVGDVPNRAHDTLTITATVDNPGPGNDPVPITNTAVAASTTYDPILSNNTSSATITPPFADVAVTKTVDDPTPNVGDVVTFTVTLRNLGPNTAKNVKVSDQLPAGLTFVSATRSQGTYNANTGLWSVGTVDTLFARTLTISARVAAPTLPLVNPAPKTNSATARSTTFDPNLGNNTGSATVTPQFADLAVAKVVDNPRPNVGDTITWTVTLSNLGVDTATDVTLLDQLPAGVQLLMAMPSQGSYNAVTGIWMVGTLTTATPATLIFTSLVVAGTAQTNVATVAHSDQFDPNPFNNRASATETPLAADLAVRKVVNNPHPVVNTVVTYTLIVHNLGPDTAINVMLADTFPPGTLTLVGTPKASQGTFDPVTGVWVVGDMASGVTATLTFMARVNVVGPIVNTVVGGSGTFDPNLSNNRGRAEVGVLPPFVSKRSFLAN
jgi:uncharacterized repeat protein (TIGR01451 family)/fimbrial isopeptide formation D2 family protein